MKDAEPVIHFDVVVAEHDSPLVHFCAPEIQQVPLVFLPNSLPQSAPHEVTHVRHRSAGSHGLPVEDSDTFSSTLDVEEHVIKTEVAVNQTLRRCVPFEPFRTRICQIVADPHVFGF